MINLPYPPVNDYYSAAKNKRVLSKSGRVYKAEAAFQVVKQGVQLRQLSDCALCIHVRPPQVRDVSVFEVAGPVIDALTEAGVILDESCIHDVRIVRLNVKKGGEVNVLVSDRSEANG